ncbi:MDR family MFS transporter [Elioraea sp.]|uniref:MDR family MFS transporter n=1 Tax=Elioraea sp. TaxID=2185103 RepID=UPI003F72C6B3
MPLTRVSPDDPAPSRPPRLTALVVAAALFMQNMDSTVIATALPAIAAGFGSDVVTLSLALTAYMLSLAVFIPASGWLADRFGARRVFQAAIVVFTVGSALCGLAPTLAFLVAARVVQGMGGALMVPVGRLVLLRSVPKSQLVSAMAWLSIPALMGPLLGPPVGGLIVTHASWRWIFALNIPVGLIGLVLATRVIPETRGTASRRLDGPGLALSGLALAGIILGGELLTKPVLGVPAGLGVLAVGLTAGAVYLRHAQRSARPVLDLRLLSVPSFGLSVAAGTLFRIGVGAIPFLLPSMIQMGFGWSAAEAGLITFSASVGAIAMKMAAAPLLRRFGFRRLLVLNGALSAASIGAMGLMGAAWPVWAMHLMLAVGGFFRSLQFTAFNTVAFADIRRHRTADATGFYSTAQQVSLTLGVVAAAGALETAMRVSGHAVPGAGDFSAAFFAVTLVAVLAVPVCLRLPADAGDVMAGRGG